MKVLIKCEACGKATLKWPCRIPPENHHFCSRRCYLSWQSGRRKEYYKGNTPRSHHRKYSPPGPPEQRTCLVCGENFIAKAHEPKRFCSIQCVGKWARANHIHSSKRKPRNWTKEQREAFIHKMLDNLHVRPTSIEKQFTYIAERHNLPYQYVGDGSLLIGYRNPDFINTNGSKICIEVANHFHHPDPWANKRKEHFAKYGWECFIFFCDKYNRLNEQEVLDALSQV